MSQERGPEAHTTPGLSQTITPPMCSPKGPVVFLSGEAHLPFPSLQTAGPAHATPDSTSGTACRAHCLSRRRRVTGY